MKNIIELWKEIVLLVREHGVDAVYWIVVLSYVVGIIFPDLSSEIISANNILVLGIIWLGVKFTSRKENFTIEQKNRFKSNKLVKEGLLKLKCDTYADRVFIFEGHNGKENASLLPFYYMDMTYEMVNTNHFINSEYQNLNTSLYDFWEYITEKYYFVGTVEELIKIDPKLGHRLQDDGAKYLATIILKSDGILLGVLGCSFLDMPKLDKGDIQSKLSVYSQDIASNLDLEKIKKKYKK